MRPIELRPIIETAPIYKMSLGKSAAYEAEALERGALLFQSEARLYDAVISGDEMAVERAGVKVKSENYPSANAPRNAWIVWANNIRTFLNLPSGSLVLHWEAHRDRLHWGVVADDPPEYVRDQSSDTDQRGYLFERKLRGGWRENSINEVPVSNIHPKARNLAINMATINLVQTDPDFFRALLLDQSQEEWTTRPDWEDVAKKHGWYAKPVKELAAANRKKLITPQVIQIADDFDDDIRRMADTAIKTVTYANGQSVVTTVKPKNTDMTREELEEEIGHLLKDQGNKCSLTNYAFNKQSSNKHLFPSLDRIDSSLGYIRGNLQVVTRAANFYKSASDEDDWIAKAEAMEKMAIAIQRQRKTLLSTPD
jgi:hypothetical protein